MSKNNKNSDNKVRHLTNKGLPPSEILKRCQDEKHKIHLKREEELDAEIMSKAMPHIKELQKYINDPDEIEAYLILHKNTKGLHTAVYEVWLKESLTLKFQFVSNETLRKDEDYHIALNSILNIHPPEQKIDLELLEKTPKPKFLLSLLILANFLRRDRERLNTSLESDGIHIKKEFDIKTGKIKSFEFNGTVDDDETATTLTLFDWKRVEKFLPTLSDDISRLKYLINLRAKFNKIPEVVQSVMSPQTHFLRIIDAEFERYEKLLQLGQIIKKQKAVSEVSSFERKRIIDAAVRLSEERDNWNEQDLIEEIRISKSTFYDRKRQFGWKKIQMLRDEAIAIIREKDK